MELLRGALESPAVLGLWAASAVAALGWLALDLSTGNRHLGSLMKAVWGLTVAYAGLLGVAVYAFSGRRQIRRDSVWRQAFRSVAHCYSGCGAGEILGLALSVGLLALAQLWVVLVTFTLAYVFGLALTVGPLVQDGVPFPRALKDGVLSESASIVVMEAVAIGVDLWLAGDARMGETLFWSSLVLSLSAGLLAAYPVNLWLIREGVKEGMHDPRTVHAH